MTPHADQDLVQAEQIIRTATHPEDLFGEHEASIPIEYRRLAAMVHPDRFANSHPRVRAAAERAFVRLNELRIEADFKLSAGTYGDRAAPTKAPPPFTPITLEFRGQKYHAESVLCDGDVCTLYRAGDYVLKVARVPAHNDLVENEARILDALVPKDRRDGTFKFFRYLPMLHASFNVRSASGPRRVNVIRYHPDVFSLAAVRRAYQYGIDFRDAAWMLRRMLEGLGWIHEQGYVHGAVLPPHVLIHPTDHGARIIDWSYAVKRNERIVAISSAHRDFYPPEVLAKQPATPATDIFMWARCGEELLNDEPAANPVRKFFAGCRFSQSRRPQSAWELYDEFSELLVRMVGKPKFRPFTMPGA